MKDILMVVFWTILIVIAEVGKWLAASKILQRVKFK